MTQGLLQVVDQDELRGVLAHELSHVRNRDILIGSVAAAVALGITFLARMADVGRDLRRHGGGGRDRDGNMFGAIAMMILAPIAAALLQMSLSRSREYEADRSGAELLGTGEPLARALEKIDAYAKQMPMNIDPAHATAYIINPLTGKQGELREPVQHAPADRRAHRPAAPPARAHDALSRRGDRYSATVRQSRKFVNSSGTPKSCSRSFWIAACRSSRFLPVTRSWSPCTWCCTPLRPRPLMYLPISRALSSLMPTWIDDLLAGAALRRLLDLAVVDRLQRHLALDELLLEHLGHGLQPFLRRRLELDRVVAPSTPPCCRCP